MIKAEVVLNIFQTYGTEEHYGQRESFYFLFYYFLSRNITQKFDFLTRKFF